MIEEATQWFTLNKLLLNVGKTSSITFSSGRTDPDEHGKLLGITIQASLKLTKLVYLFKKLSQQVSIKTLRMAYFALVQSILSYGIIFWYWSSLSNKIFILQKRLIRIMSKKSTREHCKPLFKNLKILTFPGLYILECLVFIKKNPSYFQSFKDTHTYNTRYNSDYIIPHIRLETTRGGPFANSAKLYNALPTSIREMPLKNFKRAVKTELTVNSFYDVREFLQCELNWTIYK